jgi:Flp pilus assembly protein TadD
MTGTPPAPARPSPQGLLARRLQHAALAFETGVLEQLLAREPDNVEVLAALAEACTRMRRYRRGLELDRQLVALDPDEPLFRYNLACSLALTGELDAACAELLAAIDRGYRDFAHMERDPDLRRLRRDAGWQRVRERVARLGPADSDAGPAGS